MKINRIQRACAPVCLFALLAYRCIELKHGFSQMCAFSVNFILFYFISILHFFHKLSLNDRVLKKIEHEVEYTAQNKMNK